MAHPKITIIGGGSYLWGPQFLVDLMLTPELAGPADVARHKYGGAKAARKPAPGRATMAESAAQVVLHDIDPDALDLVYRFGQLAKEKLNSSLTLSKTGNRNDAIRDAGYVMLAISTGGLEAMRHDLEIPARYGIMQPVGDTVGPGGFSRTLRNVPVVADLARAMERLCPQAWLINYSNPMTTLTRAAYRTSTVRCIGLCHELQGTYAVLRKTFDLPQDTAFESVVGGINHFTWILKLIIDGDDGFEFIRSRLPGLPEAARKSLKFRLFDIHGILPAAGDRHIAEFLRNVITPASQDGAAFAKATAARAEFGIKLTSIADREKWRDDGWPSSNITGKSQIEKVVNDGGEFAPRRSHETVTRIIAALETGVEGVFNVNMPNAGQIDGLPRDAVVETMARVGSRGITPIPVGPLPASIAGIVAHHVYNQELTVEAALTGDRRLALQALVNDPLVADLTTAPRMLDQLLEANRSLLPQFFSCPRADRSAHQNPSGTQ